MDILSVEQFNAKVEKAQSEMNKIDEFFNSLSISKFIIPEENTASNRLYNCLNQVTWIWNRSADDTNKTQFYPMSLAQTDIPANAKTDIDTLNENVRSLFSDYISFIDDILRVKEVYSDFVDNYLNKENKFLSSNKQGEVFKEFTDRKKDNQFDYLKLIEYKKNVQCKFIKDAKGDNVFCMEIEFNSIGEFIYYDLFMGMENKFIPNRCNSCDKYFLIHAGKYSSYCENVSSQDTTKTCREIGSRKRYLDKCKNNPVWKEYNKAYKTHYARYSKKKMTLEEFEKWSVWAIEWRTKAENNEINLEEYITKIKK